MYCHMVSQHIMLVIAAKLWLNKSMTITNGKNTDMVEVPVGQSGHLGMVLVLVCIHEPLGLGGPVGTTLISWRCELVALWW